MPRVACPTCGYNNPASAAACDLCRSPLRGEGAGPPSAPPPRARRDFYSEQAANSRDSWILMAAFVGLVVAVAWVAGEASGLGPAGLLLGVACGSIGALLAYYAGDRMVLAASGAVEAGAGREPALHNIVEELCLASGLPKPRLYVIDSAAPNAFATGRDPTHASVAVTRGLLQKLSRDELQGVLAHEMGHLRNLDMRFATIVGILVGTVALLSDWGWRSRRFRGGRRSSGGGSALLVLLALLLAIFAPLASRLIQMAISRRRELLADASAVELTRNPGGLASALRLISADPVGLEVANRATQHLYIVNPLKSFGMDSSALFSTHPPIEARIRILESMM
ncbi:MAG: M48 family metalloprotease [Acidobacteriota bacterium]